MADTVVDEDAEEDEEDETYDFPPELSPEDFDPATDEDEVEAIAVKLRAAIAKKRADRESLARKEDEDLRTLDILLSQVKR